jgi:hypothetical protein
VGGDLRDGTCAHADVSERYDGYIQMASN